MNENFLPIRRGVVWLTVFELANRSQSVVPAMKSRSGLQGAIKLMSG
jgi:hypothetical protein